MNIRIFTVSIFDDGKMQEELNKFLSGNKVLDVEQQMVQHEKGAYWCFCVKYLERAGNYTKSSNTKKRVDYREKLDEATFKKFSKLREIRKQIAAKDAVPAYMVFTDEELAALAELPVVTKQEMLKIKGIGDKKVEKYGEQMIAALTM